MRLVAVLLAVLLGAAVTTPMSAQTPRDERAARLSLWGTLLPVAAGAAWWAAQGLQTGSASSSPDSPTGPVLLIAGGFVLGPTFGYSSAGLGGRGMRGAAIRTGLTLLSFAPAMAICGWDCGKGDRELDLAWLMIATGTGLSAVSAVYDIASLKRNIRRLDETTPAPAFSITPTYEPGRRAGGVRVDLAF